MDAKPSARRCTRAALTTLVVAAGALAITGCGGSSGPGIAHIPTASTASTSANVSSVGDSSSSASPASREQAMLAFAKCMRANGVPDFPDPTAGGGGFFLRGGTDPALLAAAQAKCRKLMPGGGPAAPGTHTSPSPQTLARFLKVAQCMRKHGVPEFPDPKTSVPTDPFGSDGYGVISDIEGVIFVFPHTIDEQSPRFAQVAAACRFPLHNH